MSQNADERFFDELPAFGSFEGVVEARNYYALPDSWALATADIVGSTGAIAEGRYKAVNMAGAAVIAALQNALARRDIPFVFGGDGALVAVPASDQDTTRVVLGRVQTWVREQIDLVMRTALVPVRDIRAAGHDVRVAKFQAAPEVSYAMFSGGGASWAESEMKAGRFIVAAAPASEQPDLTGLSCRWNPIVARNGAIVSVIAVPEPDADAERFRKLVADLVALVGEQARGGHPVSVEDLKFPWPPKGVNYELRAVERGKSRFGRRLRILFEMGVAKLLDATGGRLGGFDPQRYKTETAQNSDFRKFDDGLKLTVDVSDGVYRSIEALLEQASREGICRYGLHRQDEALMTCIVPSALQRDHLHFIDGAAGGYAMAASRLKSKLKAA